MMPNQLFPLLSHVQAVPGKGVGGGGLYGVMARNTQLWGLTVLALNPASITSFVNLESHLNPFCRLQLREVNNYFMECNYKG